MPVCYVRHVGTRPAETGRDRRLDERVTTTGAAGRRESEAAAMRREYESAGLTEADLAADWLTQFRAWFADTTAAGLPEPNAMIVATADERGRPSARTVLLKGLDERGFAFFTNYGSRKAAEIAVNPYASVVFPWHELGRQVIVCGRVERVSAVETEAYFDTRPRESRLGAWASPQSQVIAGRGVLDEALADVERRFDGVDRVPPPPHWGGLRVVPETVEFWQGQRGRLHDRLRYRDDGEGWVVERLGP
jgi:pyridoxamine 5'-phosphate oxidase